MKKDNDQTTLSALLVVSLCQSNKDAFELFRKNPYQDKLMLKLIKGMGFQDVYESASKNIRNLISRGL